jgi:hypothetical protein
VSEATVTSSSMPTNESVSSATPGEFHVTNPAEAGRDSLPMSMGETLPPIPVAPSKLRPNVEDCKKRLIDILGNVPPRAPVADCGRRRVYRVSCDGGSK